MNFSRLLRPLSLTANLLLSACATDPQTDLQEICKREGNTVYIAENLPSGEKEYCIPARGLATVLAAPAEGLGPAISQMKISGFTLPNDDPNNRAAYRIGSSLQEGELNAAILPILSKELTASPFADGVLSVINRAESYKIGVDIIEAMLRYPGKLKEFNASRNEEADLKSIQFLKTLIGKTSQEQHSKLLNIAGEFPDSPLMMALLLNKDTRKEALSQLALHLEQFEGADDPVTQTVLATAFNLKDQHGKYVLDAKSPKVNELLEYVITNAFYPESLKNCSPEEEDICMDAKVQAAFAAII